MENLLITLNGAHERAYPPATPRVRTHHGDGALVYATDDGWIGVRLDGETRVDEYPGELVTRIEAAQLAVAA